MPEAEHLEETSFDQARGQHCLWGDSPVTFWQFSCTQKRGQMRFWMAFFVTHFKESVDFFLTHGDMIWTSRKGGGSSSISPVGRILRSTKNTWGASVEILDLRSAGIGIHADVQGSVFCFRSFVLLVTDFGNKQWPKKRMIIFCDHGWFFMIMFFLDKPALLHFLWKKARTQRSMWMFGWLLIVPAGKVEV